MLSRCVRAAYLLPIGMCCVLVGCGVPYLESQLGGPNVKDVVNHINCELASVVNTVSIKRDGNHKTMYYKNGMPQYTIDDEAPAWLKEKGPLLALLIDKHFVAAAQLTLDVIDTEGVNPSVSFITPFYPGTTMSTMYNYTLAVGGSLSGTQERNIGFGYSIDLETLQVDGYDENGQPIKSAVASECQKWYGVAAENGQVTSGAQGGIGGDLGLARIIIDGLEGLDATAQVNIYGSSGPTLPTTTRVIGVTLENASGTNPLAHPLHLLPGSISISPSTTDPHALGSATLTASTSALGSLINLTGSTLIISEQQHGKTIRHLALSLTGNVQFSRGDNATKLGYSPKLNVIGTIPIKDDWDYDLSTPVKLTGVLSPDTATGNSNADFCKGGACDVTLIFESTSPISFRGLPAAGFLAGGGGGAAGAPSKGAVAPVATGSSQFSSYVNFVISSGLNGGPNWVLKTFKGPSGGGGGGGGGGSSSGGGSSGGGGGGGQLLSATRTNTDSLTITFVAACQDKQKPVASSYWDTLPVCDYLGILKSGAANTATQYNILSTTGKAQY
jgi:uncharacterized membrane protein YgcG